MLRRKDYTHLTLKVFAFISTFSEQVSGWGVYELLHDEEAVPLHEAALYLPDVYGGVQGLAEVHHNAGLENLQHHSQT